MDIGTWLRELGLERYEHAFRENEIDAEILPKLTTDDLKDIGVTAVGHRRKLLEAIAVLAEPAPQAVPSVPADSAAIARPAEAERRQLTVLFCDLVGSTELSGRLDPEDLRSVIAAYQDTAAEVVKRWDGHIARFLGDGVLVYFGYPQAHEDDAERSVRAGLELVDRVGQLSAGDGTRLSARVGIATGLVVVGDLLGEVEDKDAVAGETPNLAARLQALAESGTVVVASSTRSLLGSLFDLTDLGGHSLKGFAQPVQAWRVTGASRAESRFEALRGGHVTPLIGREQELAILLERWAWAKEGDGQVVLIPGEPGIGKSRLVRALRGRLADEPHLALSHFCSPYHTNSALYPVIAQLERAARLTRDDQPEAQLAKVEGLLAQASRNLDEVVPLVAPLLSIPTGERYAPLNLSPQRQKQRTLEVLADQLDGLAARQLVIEVYEDVHWIDPSSLELLELVVERVRRLRALLLITYRPEFVPPWSGQAHVTMLTMNRLGRRQGVAMVDRLTDGKALPAEVLDQIVQRTDGIPLFVEELTKTVLESGLLTDAGDRFELTGPLPPLAIPSTLQDSLMARLDRLAPVKEVAQIGAVIGREFSHEVLAAVTSMPEERLGEALDQLVAAELIFRRGTPPAASYSFKHALVQDAAYQSLLKPRRQQLHAAIAELLEARSPETATQRPELLARHLTEAGLAARAIEYWQRAGQQAIGRSASREAVAHFRKALDLLQKLPGTPDRKLQEIDLQSGLGGALINVSGVASRDLEETYVRARELCQDVGNTRGLFLVEWGLCHIHLCRAEYIRAREFADRLLAFAAREQDPELVIQANHAAWGTYNLLGEAATTRAAAERAWALYDRERHSAQAFVYGGHDPAVCSRNLGSWAMWRLGYPDQALEWQEAGLSLAKEQPHPQMLAHTFTWASCLHQFRRDPGRLREQAELAVGLAREQAIANNEAEASMLLGWLMAEEGAPEEGIRLIRESMKVRQSGGQMFHHSYFLGLLAQGHARAEKVEEALGLVSEALDFVEARSERWYEPELHRLAGEFSMHIPGGDPEVAERHFRRALHVAQAQQAKSWELRAAISLARVWADGARRSEALELLSPIYDWFTEGLDTPDLVEARELLEQMG